MEEKGVRMLLEVDLECDRCFKKVMKVLAKFPKIRVLFYDVKQGVVLIEVVCCKPEKIMKKIYSEGNGSIKSIKKEEKKEEKKEKKKEEKKEEKREGENPNVGVQSAQGYPPPPWLACRCLCYERRPCYQYHGYGIPALPPCYVGTPIYDSYGGREYYVGHSSHYCNPENPTGCTIM